MKFRHTVIVGFMLFALFFGAGNLIFPAELGLISGEHFWTTIFAFVITGIGLPILAIAVGSISKGGYKELFKVIHPIFALVLMIIIYLTIGPFFAIPRTATVSYEMSVVPLIGESSTLSLLIFTILFFIIVLVVSLFPSKIATSLGKYLTPLLLLVITIFIIGGVVSYFGNDYFVNDHIIDENAFGVGFTQGYLTMDAIAAIAFSVIVISSLRQFGFNKPSELLRRTLKSGILAAVILAVIYTLLAWIGNRAVLDVTEFSADANIGSYVLTFVSNDVFGTYGTLLLGLVVLSACLTTAIGLIVAVSEYFNEIIPKVPYELFAIIFTLISFGLANQGLAQVIATSVPVLYLIYPIAISSVILILIAYFVPSPRFALQLPLILVFLVTVPSVIHRQSTLDLSLVESLPLYQSSLEWLLFLVVGYIIGYLIARNYKKIEFNETETVKHA